MNADLSPTLVASNTVETLAAKVVDAVEAEAVKIEKEVVAEVEKVAEHIYAAAETEVKKVVAAVETIFHPEQASKPVINTQIATSVIKNPA